MEQKGLVAGLFNIPTEAIFDACTDFCIEAPVAESSKDVIKLMAEQSTSPTIDAMSNQSKKTGQVTTVLLLSDTRTFPPTLQLEANSYHSCEGSEMESMSIGLKMAVKKANAAKHDLEAAHSRIRELTGQALLMEEQVEADKKKAAAEQKKSKDGLRELEKKLADALSRTSQLSESLRIKNEALQNADVEYKKLSGQFQTMRSKQEEKAHVERKLQETIAQLENENQALRTKLQNQEKSFADRLSALEEENKHLATLVQQEKESSAKDQLTEQLQALSESYLALQTEYVTLSGQASKLQAENFDLKTRASSSSPTGTADQNDMLNQRLLSHYRYLLTITDDQSENDDQNNAADADEWT